MPAPDELLLFAERFESIGAHYMITGATAAILYGQPRVTNDLVASCLISGRYR